MSEEPVIKRQIGFLRDLREIMDKWGVAFIDHYRGGGDDGSGDDSIDIYFLGDGAPALEFERHKYGSEIDDKDLARMQEDLLMIALGKK